MRIAIFHNLSSGGAKRALCEMTRRLSRRHRIDAFSLSTADHDFADIRPWVRSHRVIHFTPTPLLESPFGRINNVSRIADLMRLRLANRWAAHLIDRGEYDLVFVHPCRYENSPSVLCDVRRQPSVFFCQEPLRILYESPPVRPYDQDHSGRRRWLDRVDPFPGIYRAFLRRRDYFNIGRADRVLVNSKFMSECVHGIYGVDPHVNYLGVDTAKFRPLPVDRERLLLSVGSLTPMKGFDFLIRSMALIPADERPPLAIVCNFANPPETRYLEELARESSVDLRIRENISESELIDYYNRASLVVYSPIREPFGFVPLEAMSCGTPLLAVNEGGIPESVVDGKTGVLVGREPAQFAAAVRQLLDDTGARRSALGHLGRLHVEKNWSWERSVEALEGHFLKCVSET